MPRYTSVIDFIPLQRVELHPGTDAWMRGDRFGTVEALGFRLVHVRMDKSGKLLKLFPTDILEILSNPSKGAAS